MVAFVSHQREAIHRAVRDMYTAVATAPKQGFHFPTGRRACEALGYPEHRISTLPEAAVESFAGVGYPFAAEVIREGDVVLDLGSGSGTDALISAKLVGPSGRVYALDMTAPMREKLQSAAGLAGVTTLQTLEGDAESIPLPDASVDVVTTNGVLNLVPDKPRAIAEIYRVLKPGGRLQIADIALARPVSERFRQDPQMWAECVVGAVDESRYLEMLRAAGFEGVEPLGNFDYFGLSTNSKTREVAGLFNAHAVTLRAAKPLVDKGLQKVSRRRAAAGFIREFAGVSAAMVAWFVCAGVPALLAAFGAIGAAALTAHAVMFPAFAGLLGVSVWLIWRSGWLRDDLRPFWLALAGASFAIVTTWLSLVGLYPWMGWWPYIGVATVVAASGWSFRLARQPGNCLNEMIREVQWRERLGSPVKRVAIATAAIATVTVSLVGLSALVTAYVPG
jgi:arsenite methyltransferase